MKISKIGLNHTYNINQIKQNSDNTRPQQTHSEKKIKEDISLSGKNEIKKYKEMVKNMSEIREDRVKELKNSIEQGNYKVNAKEVANKILEDIILGAK